MTRARDLSRFTNPSAVSVEAGTFNIGIGSTSPDVKLDVIGSIEASGISTFQNNLFVGAGITMLASSGIVSAVSFYGDFYGNGENLTGVASTDNIITDTLAQFNGGVGIADSIFHIGDDNTAIRFPAADTFTVETNGSERVRIDSSGKVGIGTSTGTTRALRVKAPSTNSAHISLIDTDSTQEIWQVGNQADGDAFMQLLTDEGDVNIKFDASGVNYINGGNVGINTNNPGAKLHVYGNSASEVVTLTDGATITPDFSTGNNFTVTLGDNRTLANPTNTTVGQSGVLYIVQDGTGSRTLGVGTHWHFPAGTAPTLTTTANAVDVFAFSVRSSTSVVANAILDVKVTA